MGYLIGETLIYLILAAVIGAAIAWLLRGAGCRSSENQLKKELEQTRSELETAETNGRSLESALNELRAEMDSETRKLEARIRGLEIENGKLQETLSELEPLPGKVQERDTIIGHWERDFQNLQQQSESKIAKLQDKIAGLLPLQAELENSQKAYMKLNTELQALQTVAHQENQKALQISNLQNEIKQLQSVSAKVKERDTTVEHLQSQLRSQAKSKDEEIARLQKELQTQHRSRREKIDALAERLTKIEHLPQTLAEHQQKIIRLQEQLGNVEQLKNQELSVLKAKIKTLEPFKTAAHEHSREVDQLKRELAASKARAKPAAGAAKSGRRPRKKQLYTAPKEKDDLKLIYGIGPVMERTLNNLGVTSFQQIASFSRQDIERVAEALQSFPDRIMRDNWVEGAKKEYRKKYGKAI